MAATDYYADRAALSPAPEAPIEATPTLLRVTTSGTLAAGLSRVSFANVGGANGTVLGMTLQPAEVVTFGDRNMSLTAIAYDAIGTEFLITTEDN